MRRGRYRKIVGGCGLADWERTAPNLGKSVRATPRDRNIGVESVTSRYILRAIAGRRFYSSIVYPRRHSNENALEWVVTVRFGWWIGWDVADIKRGVGAGYGPGCSGNRGHDSVFRTWDGVGWIPLYGPIAADHRRENRGR